MKTYVYRLYPTKAQERRMEATVDECRFLWNCALEQRILYHQRGKNISRNEQQFQLKDIDRTYSSSQTYQRVIEDLDLAFQSFFR